MFSESNSDHKPQFSFDWLFFAPPALQIAAQVNATFLLQGIFGVFLTLWRELTQKIWSLLASFINLDISEYIGIFDGLTLALLLFGAGVSFRIRNKGAYIENPETLMFQKNQWVGLLSLFKIAVPVSLVIFMMMIPLITQNSSGAINFYALLFNIFIIYVAFSLSLCLRVFHNAGKSGSLSGTASKIYAALTYFLGFIFSSLQFLLFSFGAFVIVILFYQIELLPYITRLLRFEEHIPWLIMLSCYVSIFLSFGLPEASKIKSESGVPINILIFILFACAMLIPLRNIILNADGTWVPILVLVVMLVSMLAAFFLVKTNYLIARNILLVAAIFVTTDFVTSWAAELLKS